MPAPPPPDQNLPDSVLLQKWAGLKNTVEAERLQPNELEKAQNIDIDDAGQIHQRRGWEKKLSGNFHSLYRTSTGLNLVVKDGSLVVVHPDFSLELLGDGFGDEPLAWEQIGSNVYFSSSVKNGIINLTTWPFAITPWGRPDGQDTWLSPVVNPTATLAEVRGKLLGRPPMATALAYWNGRMYLANGPTLWATELYLYNYVDKNAGFKQFETDIMVLGAVTDGLYVGTRDGIWWLDGPFKEMKRIPLSGYGAIPGSLVYVPAELVNPQVPQDQYTQSKNAVVFLTESGLVAGLDGGNLFNLTQEQFLFPKATSAAALFRREKGVNQYVMVLDSEGDPTNNARIGDFLDADIRRVGDWGYLADGVKFGDEFVADVV